MNKTSWIIFIVVVVVLLGGLVAWARISNPSIDVSGIENNSVIAASTQNGDIADHTKGSSDNKILLIEYGDFQCPSCAAANPNVLGLMEEYGDSVTLIFRNFPLTSIHPNAKTAAAVAESAGLQGKYWEMHNNLYDLQNEWSSLSATERTGQFQKYAEALGLDMDQFNSDLSSANVNQKISFDMAIGKEAGVSATPTFYLNGEKLDDTVSSGIVQGDLTDIKEMLDALIAAEN